MVYVVHVHHKFQCRAFARPKAGGVLERVGQLEQRMFRTRILPVVQHNEYLLVSELDKIRLVSHTNSESGKPANFSIMTEKRVYIKHASVPLSRSFLWTVYFMETAIMIDGAFIRRKFRSSQKRAIAAGDLQTIVHNALGSAGIQTHDYRAYFYDCKPCSEKTSLPISHAAFGFDTSPQYRAGIELIKNIKLLPFFAVREGVLSFNGWTLKPSCYGASPLEDGCFTPNLKQKGVDIKIGLDVAWVSFNKIAGKIVLVTGDSDFVPVIKTARRNGVFVYLFTLNHNVKKELSENVDVVNTLPVTALLSTVQRI